MNSVRLFNYKFFVQNIKKSKAALGLFLGIMPIFTILSLILMSNNQTYSAPGLGTISIVNILGMYIIPIILSVCLFGFMFKRKSSDFINSMPISRSTIFVTNTFYGILLLILMVGITAILLFLTSAFFPNLMIPLEMIIDYFVIWSVIYVFVFTAANLAATICGNVITQLVVTAIILFLVPFIIHMFSLNDHIASISCMENGCAPLVYDCGDDTICLNEEADGIYKASVSYEYEYKFTAPYQFVASVIMGDINFTFGIMQLIKMVLLSLIYIVLGFVLFRKRSMEVTETSFKNIHMHMIIKSLTLVPMVIVFDMILFNSGITSSLFILLCILLVYYFVYDLITKRNIDHIRLSLLYFIVTLLLISSLYYVANKVHDKEVFIDRGSVKEVALSLNELPNSTYDTYIADDTLIDLVFKSLVSDAYYETDYSTYFASLKMDNGSVYTVNVSAGEEGDYEKILEIVSNNTLVNDDFNDINYDKVYAIRLDNLGIIDPKYNDEILKLLENEMDDMTLSKYISLDNNGFDIDLVAYVDHKKITYTLNSKISSVLTRRISGYINETFKNEVLDKNMNYYLYVYGSNDDYVDADYFTSRNKDEFWNFISENINKTCDITKPYIAFDTYNGENYKFYTNNVAGFEELLAKLREEAKDDPRYIEFMG